MQISILMEVSGHLQYFTQSNLNEKLDMVAHNFNPATQETEAGRSLKIQGQPDLCS